MRSLIPTLVVFLFSLTLSAQVNQVNYEGQPVGAVDLVTDPTIDVHSLEHLVAQKAGQPYSNEEVQATVAALNRTGIFKKIDVQVKPGSRWSARDVRDGAHLLLWSNAIPGSCQGFLLHTTAPSGQLARPGSVCGEKCREGANRTAGLLTDQRIFPGASAHLQRIRRATRTRQCDLPG